MIDAKQLAIEIKQHLNHSMNNIITDVVIFGSRIKGGANEYSDYDVLIVLNTNYDRGVQKLINDLCYDIDLKYNIFLDTQIISEYELNNTIRGKHPILKAH